MRRVFHLLMASGIVWVVAACRGGSREADVQRHDSEITVHEGIDGPAKFLKLPAPIKAARWTEVPIVRETRHDIGPSDNRLYVVVAIDTSAWGEWKRVLSMPAAPGVYYLPEEVAAKILPPDWLAATSPDTLGRGRRLEGKFYIPDSIATAWYRGQAAVRHGEYLFMEFLSK